MLVQRESSKCTRCTKCTRCARTIDLSCPCIRSSLNDLNCCIKALVYLIIMLLIVTVFGSVWFGGLCLPFGLLLDTFWFHSQQNNDDQVKKYLAFIGIGHGCLIAIFVLCFIIRIAYIEMARTYRFCARSYDQALAEETISIKDFTRRLPNAPTLPTPIITLIYDYFYSSHA
jgi:hypothetical protein